MNQNINVDLIPKFAVYGNLYFSQYDVGREAIINLVNESTEYEIPSGATVTLVATKPSGLGFTQNCTFEGNQITVVCTAEMTDEAGHFPCELRISNGSLLLGTANFTFNVERSPHPEGTTDGTADSVISQITVAFESAMTQIENSGGLTSAIKNAILNCFQKVAWIDEHGQTYYDALVDAFYAVTSITLNANSLLFNSFNETQQLIATLMPSSSQALVVWESSDSSVATVSSDGLVTSVANGGATITASVGEVFASCSVVVAQATVVGISAVLNAGSHVFNVGDPVDSVKPYLTVTATYSDSTTVTVPSGSYTLSGSLSEAGENIITVSYEGQTTTVTVTAISSTVVSISAVYTQSGTVYDTDTLDYLKSDLVVTATWSDASTSTIASTDYTLSGVLAVGTSTVTVTYDTFTATFNVNVTSGETTITVTWSGSGVENTASPAIDATNYDVYYELPFVEGAWQLSDGTTASSVATKWQAMLYTDSERTNFVGYWYGGSIEDTARTTANKPSLVFDTKTKVAPKGYYVLFKAFKQSAFTSNDACRNYLNNNGKTVNLAFVRDE